MWLQIPNFSVPPLNTSDTEENSTKKTLKRNLEIKEESSNVRNKKAGKKKKKKNWEEYIFQM